jgi:hypothetical protein
MKLSGSLDLRAGSRVTSCSSELSQIMLGLANRNAAIIESPWHLFNFMVIKKRPPPEISYTWRQQHRISDDDRTNTSTNDRQSIDLLR